MIETIRMSNFQAKVECRNSQCSSIESFLPINYTFKSGGVYALISDFGCGSWGVATCLTGRITSDYTGEVYLNEEKICIQELSNSACFLAESTFHKVNTIEQPLTPSECIHRALMFSGLPYTAKEIKKIFSLTNERFEKPLEYCSGEIWPISMAVNYALGKHIFCFPWLNMITISRLKYFYESGILRLLRETGKIVIVPSSQKRYLKHICDHTILFAENKIIYK